MLVDVDPPLVELESAPVVEVDEGLVPVAPVVDDPVDVSPDDVELAEDDSEEVPVVSAAATPWPVATAVTSHAATAMPPNSTHDVPSRTTVTVGVAGWTDPAMRQPGNRTART